MGHADLLLLMYCPDLRAFSIPERSARRVSHVHVAWSALGRSF